MAQASLRPPSTVQPRPKAVPTFSNASIGAISRSGTPQLSRPSSESRQTSPTRSSTPLADSEKTPASLIRRVLCPNAQNTPDKEQAIEEALPPLTSSNEIDQELYAILSIIVKDLVQTWYSKITPDQSFVEELAKIVAHCTRAIESRLRSLDVESLLLDEIPGLIETHIHAYRTASEVVRTQELSTSLRAIYHDLNPHPALASGSESNDNWGDDKQRSKEADYRQLLVQAALAVLLPTEDLENACLRALVADVTADAILGNSIGGKISENWYIWSGIAKAVGIIQTKILSTEPITETEPETRSRLEKFGLLSDKKGLAVGDGKQDRSLSSSILWRSFHLCYLAVTLMGTFFLGLLAARKTSRHSQAVPKPPGSVSISSTQSNLASTSKPRPIVDFRLFSLISTLLGIRHRMPWLAGMFSLSQYHLSRGWMRRVGGTDCLLDQYLHHLLQTHLLSAQLLPELLALARQTLFPRNSLPPPAAPPPSPEQVKEIKQNCARSILSLLPAFLCRRLLGDDQVDWAREIELELDVWADSWMNKHLAYKTLDLVIVRVLPEMAEKGVTELMEARLGQQP